jgi:hypothetical protein
MILSRQYINGIGLAAAALAAVALAAANFTGSGENGGGPEYAVTLGVSLILALALFGWVIPRTDRSARAGLVVGLLAILSVAVYWTGLPYVLGPAAVVLGLVGRSRGESPPQATTAVVLGALAAFSGIVSVLLDQALQIAVSARW